MYLANRMHMQMHWHPLSLHWLLQPEQKRRYSYIVMPYTIQSSSLKNIRLQSKAFKSKKFLKPQQVWNLGIGDSHSSTMSYMAYYLMISRRQLPSEEKHLDSTTMCSHEHYIADHMIGSYFATFRTKRHRKLSEKLVRVCVELTNSDPNLKIESKDLATTG